MAPSRLHPAARRSLLCAVGFSTLQEKLYRTPGFKFGGFLTFVTCEWGLRRRFEARGERAT